MGGQQARPSLFRNEKPSSLPCLPGYGDSTVDGQIRVPVRAHTAGAERFDRLVSARTVDGPTLEASSEMIAQGQGLPSTYPRNITTTAALPRPT
jgi:hypothetical protein